MHTFVVYQWHKTHAGHRRRRRQEVMLNLARSLSKSLQQNIGGGTKKKLEDIQESVR
jgi:hypothetical protein